MSSYKELAKGSGILLVIVLTIAFVLANFAESREQRRQKLLWNLLGETVPSCLVKNTCKIYIQERTAVVRLHDGQVVNGLFLDINFDALPTPGQYVIRQGIRSPLTIDSL